jgi:hypothetical protein
VKQFGINFHKLFLKVEVDECLLCQLSNDGLNLCFKYQSDLELMAMLNKIQITTINQSQQLIQKATNEFIEQYTTHSITNKLANPFYKYGMPS